MLFTEKRDRLINRKSIYYLLEVFWLNSSSTASNLSQNPLFLSSNILIIIKNWLFRNIRVIIFEAMEIIHDKLVLLLLLILCTKTITTLDSVWSLVFLVSGALYEASYKNLFAIVLSKVIQNWCKRSLVQSFVWGSTD